MALFAKKMDQPVISPGEFVHIGGDDAKLTFRPDLIEIDRKELGQLLYQVIGRADRGMEQVAHVPLEQVRIADVDASEGQVDNQGREQGLGSQGFLSMISSQMRTLGRWAGFISICQCWVTLPNCGVWNPMRTIRFRKKAMRALFSVWTTSSPIVLRICSAASG